MGRAPCCSKVGLHRGPWTPKEDSLLITYINTHGEGQWRSLPKKAGLLRCGKSCRLRWMNYLRPDIRRGNITADEDDLIIRLHALLGNRWSLIAGRLPGRTDNEIKNYWNTHLSKKLRSQGTDPDTHKKLSDNDPAAVPFKPVKSKKRKTTSTSVNVSKKKKQNQTVIPTTSKIVVSRSCCNDENNEGKTKIHQPKPVRVTAPLSLTRNSSNTSFESNLTSLTSSNGSSTGAGEGGAPSWPPTSDYSFNNDNGHRSSSVEDDGLENCYDQGGVRFLIGCDDDDDDVVVQYGSHTGDLMESQPASCDEHCGKFEKLYDEYLQLIKVDDLNNYGDDFNHQPQDHELMDFFAESLLI